MLFDCTIAENIQYGVNSRSITMEEVIEASKKAYLHDFVMNLPDVSTKKNHIYFNPVYKVTSLFRPTFKHLSIKLLIFMKLAKQWIK